MGKLTGKVALITGGSKGIGLATAKLFAAEGAKIIITGRNLDDLRTAAQEIGGDVMFIQSDAGKLQETKALFQKIRERYQKIDTVFINAGIAEGAPIDRTTEENFDRHVDINYKGAFFTAKESLPFLAPQASIIFTASVAANMGIENLSIYSSTKAAVVSLTKTLAADLASRGIRVNAISPGYIATPLAMRNNRDNYHNICESIPLEKRFGSAEEIAKVALFLACDATYMTGENMIVDGGLSAITPPPRSRL